VPVCAELAPVNHSASCTGGTQTGHSSQDAAFFSFNQKFSLYHSGAGSHPLERSQTGD